MKSTVTVRDGDQIFKGDMNRAHTGDTLWINGNQYRVRHVSEFSQNKTEWQEIEVLKI